jgi:hypothetical protein
MLSKITNKPLLNQDGSHVEVDSPILVLSYDGEEDCQVLRYSDTLIENSYPNVLNNLIQKEEYELCDTLQSFNELYNNKK